jgi:hypothetical protein
MAEKTYEGKTHAEWLAFHGRTGIGCPAPEKTEEALLWFKKTERQAELERDELRFCIQVEESRRQSRSALIVAVLAFLVSLAGIAYQIWHDYRARP